MWRVYYPSCNTFGGLTYMRGTVMATVGGMTDPRNSHESVIVSMTFNAQPAHLIDWDLLCIFYQYLVKETSFRSSPLCLSDDDEFTKEGSRRSLPVPNSQYDVALFHSCFMIWWFDCYILLICFILSSLKLKFLGGLLDFWIIIKRKAFIVKFVLPSQLWPSQTI